jgi:hypothetical protein
MTMPGFGRVLTRASHPTLTAVTCVLASSLAFIDGSAVNVALPAIGRGVGGGAAGLQWLIGGYLLPLSSLLLFGGSLGDRYGQRRLLIFGVVLFGLASAACGLAPGLAVLIGARFIQGMGAAMLMPSSLAILGVTFDGEARGRAVGIWAAAGAATAAVGPVLGGWLVDAVSWRMIFFINLPVAAGAIALALRCLRQMGRATAPALPGPQGSPCLYENQQAWRPRRSASRDVRVHPGSWMTPEMRQDGMERAYREGLGRASSMDDDECSAIAPLVADLEGWMRTTRAKLSRHADVAKAMDYMLKRWESFNRFLNGGRICLSNNAAERALRGVAVGRKACLFAGSNRGGERAAAMYSLIVTARLNDVDPRAWLADVLRRIGDTPPPDCTGCCRGIGDPKVR